MSTWRRREKIVADGDSEIASTQFRTVLRIIILALLASFFLTIGQGLIYSRSLDGLYEEAAESQAMIQELAGRDQLLREQLESVGVEPVVPPVDLSVIPVPEVLEGGVIVTDQELAKAVASYLEVHPLQAGESLSDEEVAEAVAEYCATRNECRGPPGESGEDGQDGTDGQDGADGPTGPRGEQGESPPTTTTSETTTTTTTHSVSICGSPEDSGEGPCQLG